MQDAWNLFNQNAIKNGNVPPLTDRGVQTPPQISNNALNKGSNEKVRVSKKDTKIEMLFDWLQVTIQDVLIADVIIRIFDHKLDDCLCTQSGKFGYNRTFTIGSKIHIMDNTLRYDMGVHLLISGSACRELEKMISWKEFFSRLETFETFKFTRIDIAIDTYKNYFTIATLRKKIKKRELTSKFKNATFMEQINIKSTESESASLKFGSMSSDIYIVFYDKLKERKNAGYTIDDSVDFWVRCELRFKHDLSNQLYSKFVLNGYELGDYIQSILYNYIDFKNKNCSRIERCETAHFWKKFLGDVEKLKLTNKPLQTTIQQKRQYAEKQFSRIVSMISAVDNDFYSSLLTLGKVKITEKDMTIINSHLIAENKAPISYGELQNIITRQIERKD